MKKAITKILFCTLFCSYSAVGQRGELTAQKSIDTSFLININGVEQYLEIKGVSRKKPVLLFVHGGPSWPATPMIRKYNPDLTNDFVLVSWDQRNCGKSKSSDGVKLTTDLYVEDAHQVTQYLQKEFQVNKIFILCHSWGSIIGIYLVTIYPDDYAAYIGVGQFVNPNKSEAIAWNYVTEKAKQKNDTASLKALKEIPFTLEDGYKNGFEDLIKFRTIARDYFVNEKVAVLPNPTQLYEDYSNLDWFTPVMTTGKVLFNYMDSIKINFFQYKEFKIPIYFFTGRFDYETSSEIVEQYFKAIHAPKKKLIWFENSGHSPHWEEAALFRKKLLEVLGL